MSKYTAMSAILHAASQIDEKGRRIAYLRHIFEQPLYQQTLQFMIQGAYHPGVVWLLSRGLPDFTHGPANGDLEFVLYKETKKLYIFCKGGNDSLSQDRRQKLFTQLLEALHPEDAVLLCYVKDKIMPYPNLTYDFFNECFPGILPDRGTISDETTKPEITKAPPVENILVVSKTGANKGRVRVNDGKKNLMVPKEESHKYNAGYLPQ